MRGVFFTLAGMVFGVGAGLVWAVHVDSKRSKSKPKNIGHLNPGELVVEGAFILLESGLGLADSVVKIFQTTVVGTVVGAIVGIWSEMK